MSHIGRQPIKIPDGVKVACENNRVTADGPKGSLAISVKPEIEVKIENSQLILAKKNESGKTNALFGLYRSLINNLVLGVSQGFNKGLELSGVGYKAAVGAQELILNVGFSHQVKIKIPEGINITVVENKINVSGIDKQLVGETAAIIRRVRPPEPYKGKGIHYIGEVIRRKAGKSVKAAGAGGAK
ncbi:MAG: 50S ribosomal protein L6 [Patescibacteria group bacterium]|nr:50S ribosomal protein L6 [Patescibacteria group bacterium]